MTRNAGSLGMNYSHEALADAMLTNPTATVAELAATFGRSPAWVSLVRNSDAFREILYRRRNDTVDPVITANIEQRFQIVANRSLEILMDKLARDTKDVPDALALEAAKLGARGLSLGGFGTKAPPAPPAPDVGRIERLAERLTALNFAPRGSSEIVDVVPTGEVK